MLNFIESAKALYVELAPVLFALAAFLVIAFPIIGRLVAEKYPRFGEALIRTGADIKGALEARGLTVDAPSPSAAPLIAPAPAPPNEGAEA